MTLRERLARAWSALRDEPAKPEPTPMREAIGMTIDADEHEWRKLTGDAQRDLTPLTRQRMQEIAVYLWRATPLGNQLIELAVAYLLGEGVSVTCKDKSAQSWLDAFWKDPINRMDLTLEAKMRELALFGEQCWPAFVNEVNGHVRLGALDPALIETVVTDPDNAAQPIGVVTRKDKQGKARRYRVIVNGPEEVFTLRTQAIRQTFSDGECFYAAVNTLVTAPRGHSDLLALADWLDLYETLLYSDAERLKEMRAFFWDVTITGATKEDIQARAREIVAPKPASVRVHNEAETWKAEAPKLNTAESVEAARLFRNHVLSGRMFPEHWFGGGGDVNRATAGEMGEPTFKTLTMRQNRWRAILTDLADFVIRQRAARSGVTITEENAAEFAVAVNFPELTARDTTRYASALQHVIVAAGLAIDKGLLTDETAVLLIAAIAQQLGTKIDPADELARARAAREKRQEEDRFTPPADDPEDQRGDAPVAAGPRPARERDAAD
jgi:hypothetical protein